MDLRYRILHTAQNNNGAAINTGANTTELFQCWFHNISNTNGGAGVRALTPAVPLINECVLLHVQLLQQVVRLFI